MRRSVRGGQTVKLRYLMAAGEWPSGNPRYYLRRKGQPLVKMPDLPPEDPAFLLAYAAAMGMAKPPAPRPITGTIGAGIEAFMRADHYLAVSKGTRDIWRRHLDKITASYGTARATELAPEHIRADLGKHQGNTAVQRLKVWRALCSWWHEAGLTPINATTGIRKPKVAKTDGHPPWTRADVAKFRDHWPIDSRERLAMELILWTGARIGDVCTMTEAIIDRTGWMRFRQIKTGGAVAIPITAAAPEWAEPDGQLIAALDARPARHLSLVVTAHGTPRSIKGAPQWFSAAARAAGVKKTAHGLRKLRAIIMAENGASTHQIAAWTGHESLQEVEHYSRTADRARIISGTQSANSADQVQTQEPILLISQDKTA